MRLDFGRQAERGGDGFLAVEALVVDLLVVGIEQWVTDRAVQQGTLAVQRLIFQARKRAGLWHHAYMQAAVEHAVFDLAGRDHADLDAHIGATVLEFGQGMGDAHVRQGDQVIGQADVQLAAQMLVQAIDLGTEAFQCAEQLQG